jgi:hypothetical protein
LIAWATVLEIENDFYRKAEALDIELAAHGELTIRWKVEGLRIQIQFG